MARLAAAAEAVAAVDVSQISDADVAEHVAALRKIADMAEAAYTTSLGAFDSRKIAEVRETLSTRQWARHHLNVAPTETARTIRAAQAVRNLPQISAAFLGGRVRLAHVTAIAEAISDLGVETIAAGESELLKAAESNDPARLRSALRGLGAAIGGSAQSRRERRQHRTRWLNVATTFEGAVAVDGVLDAEAGAIVQAAIEAHARPTGDDDNRTAAQRRADALTEICGAGVAPARGSGEGVAASSHAESTEGRPRAEGTEAGSHDDPETDTGEINSALDPANTNAAGPSCGCGRARRRPSILVICDLATLKGDSFGFGELSNGEVLSGDAVRRLACDASITRIVVGPGSQPLDVGRTQRTATAAQLKALRIRDGGCRIPGCDRPAEWCDAHHVVFWSNGGTTSVTNMVLLCRKHHTAVHEGRWIIEIVGDGRFQFRNSATGSVENGRDSTIRETIAELSGYRRAA